MRRIRGQDLLDDRRQELLEDREIGRAVLDRIRAWKRPVIGIEDVVPRDPAVGDGLLDQHLHLAGGLLGEQDAGPVACLHLRHEAVDADSRLVVEPVEAAMDAHGAVSDDPGADAAQMLDVDLHRQARPCIEFGTAAMSRPPELTSISREETLRWEIQSVAARSTGKRSARRLSPISLWRMTVTKRWPRAFASPSACPGAPDRPRGPWRSR